MKMQPPMMTRTEPQPRLTADECTEFARLFTQATGLRLDLPTGSDLSLASEWQAIIRRALQPQANHQFGPQGEMRPIPQTAPEPAKPHEPRPEWAMPVCGPIPHRMGEGAFD